MLQPCSKQEMAQKTLIYLKQVEEFCASSNSVMSQSVQELSDCTTMTEVI